MIWFKIKELEQQLIVGKVSDYLAFKYMLTQFIFYNLAMYLPAGNESPFWSQGIHLIILFTALVWGFRKTFEINKAGDNRDYFKRFLSLSFVAGIRMIVFVFIFSFFLASATLIADKLDLVLIRNTTLIEGLELFGYLLFTLGYYYILITSFKRVSSTGSGEVLEAV